MKTNNKGVDPYGFHPKLLKKFKYNIMSICLHLINSAFFMVIWPFDKTIVKFLKKVWENWLFFSIFMETFLTYIPFRKRSWTSDR